MRTTLLSILFLSLAVSPALAMGGGGKSGGPKHSSTDARLKTVNDADAAVSVRLSSPTGLLAGFTLEPKESLTQYIPTSGSDAVSVTLTANLSDNSAVNVTRTATIQSGKTITATITSPNGSTLDIAFSGNGLVAALVNRDTSVALASSGGLLPLLWLGFLLGGRPRRRESLTTKS